MDSENTDPADRHEAQDRRPDGGADLTRKQRAVIGNKDRKQNRISTHHAVRKKRKKREDLKRDTEEKRCCEEKPTLGRG